MSSRKMVSKILAIISSIKAIPEIIKNLPGVFTVLKKLWNIIVGWWNRIFNKNEQLAKKRIAICDKCHSKVHIDILGDICNECGCVLAAKARVKDEKCELNKWDKL